MTPESKQDIRIALRTIAENHAATMRILQQTLNLLSDQLEHEPRNFRSRRSTVVLANSNAPFVDFGLLSIVHKGRHCFLGNTIPFRLIGKLIDRPNRYFSYRELRDEVWQCVVSDAAIRSVVKVLRAKLRKSRLHELAAAVDGSVARHYGLMLQRGER
jgi:DNA-binding response OmpR family regulator